MIATEEASKIDEGYSILNCARNWQVSVEGYNGGTPIDLVKLDGTWRLQYTSAPDVLVLLEAAARLPFFQVKPLVYNSYFFKTSEDPKRKCKTWEYLFLKLLVFLVLLPIYSLCLKWEVRFSFFVH